MGHTHYGKIQHCFLSIGVRRNNVKCVWKSKREVEKQNLHNRPANKVIAFNGGRRKYAYKRKKVGKSG